MAEVTIRELQKSYGAVQVIHRADVEIEDGQFVVLVGPSGCGKPILLRMIAGLEENADGNIQTGDGVVNNLRPASAISRRSSRITRCTRVNPWRRTWCFPCRCAV